MSSPQSVFDDVFAIEADMSGLAATAVHLHPKARADALARLAVAAEGVRQLFGTLLQLGPTEIPFRGDFASIHDLMCSRERALQELVLRGDFSVAQAMNVANLVDVTAGPLRDLLMKMGWLQGALGVHLLVYELTKDIPGAGFASFSPVELAREVAREEEGTDD
jgi:hypothetical protein